MKRLWIIALIILIVVAIVGYNYIYKDHRNIENETAEFSITVKELTQLFSADVQSSEQQFLNKTIEVTGQISAIKTNTITLEDKVFCQFSNAIKATLKVSSKTQIKGRVIGYDDLLEQIKLDQCIIIDQK